MIRLILLSILIASSLSIRDDPKYWRRFGSKMNLKNDQTTPIVQSSFWFTQIVDHYNYQTSPTWQQRYWVADSFYNPRVGPVFLYICGEWVCDGVPDSVSWVMILAQKLQGLVFAVEHRYYGQSMPFGKDSVKLENMKYLNSEQALSDLAYFIQQMKETHSYNIRDDSPFITIGGSYPGALSAWFRYKYPHLAIGSIASSAVIMAIEDFKNYDEQIYLSSVQSGDFCYKAINSSNVVVEGILKSSEALQFKSQFKGGEKLTDDEFLFFWIDAIVAFIQYGERTTLCNNLQNRTPDQQLAYLVQNAKQFDVYQYGSYYLKNVTFALENGQVDRSWYYQSCTEFGYWQTYSDRHPMRSFRLNLDFYRKFCDDSFGNNTWPKVERKNIQYGALSIKGSNIFMTNGGEDPWRWASLQQSNERIISMVADCSDCAHCVDLYTPSSQDPIELKRIRDQQYLSVLGWVESHWRNLETDKKDKIVSDQKKSQQARLRRNQKIQEE